MSQDLSVPVLPKAHFAEAGIRVPVGVSNNLTEHGLGNREPGGDPVKSFHYVNREPEAERTHRAGAQPGGGWRPDLEPRLRRADSRNALLRLRPT